MSYPAETNRVVKNAYVCSICSHDFLFNCRFCCCPDIWSDKLGSIPMKLYGIDDNWEWLFKLAKKAPFPRSDAPVDPNSSYSWAFGFIMINGAFNHVDEGYACCICLLNNLLSS